MTKPRAIDRDALHRILFRKADRLGRLKLNLRALSDELELGYCNLSVVISEMAQAGRLKPIAGPRNGRKTYVVVDPASYQAPDKNEPPAEAEGVIPSSALAEDM